MTVINIYRISSLLRYNNFRKCWGSFLKFAFINTFRKVLTEKMRFIIYRKYLSIVSFYKTKKEMYFDQREK